METVHLIGSIASILGFGVVAVMLGTKAGRSAITRYIHTHAPSCGLIPQEGVLLQVGFCGRCGADFLWLGYVTYTENYWSNRLPWLRWFTWMNRGVVKKVLTFNWTFHRCPSEFDQAFTPP